MQKKWGIRKIAESMGLPVRKKNECQETLKKVMSALDDELTEEEEKEFLNHINGCSHCLEKYEIEKCFKEFLTEKITRHNTPTAIADKIRAHILGRFPRE